VIQQGDKYGQHLFVVDSGELDCFKELEKSKEPKFLKKYKPGEAFGELALLYNAPRAATIKCASDVCVLFALDREAFNHIVREATVKKREKYEKLLVKIDLLKNIDSYEKLQIIDALKAISFKKGEFIIKQVFMIIFLFIQSVFLREKKEILSILLNKEMLLLQKANLQIVRQKK